MFLQNWGFYELTFFRDGPYSSKGNVPPSLMNGPLSFKNGLLLGPLRLGAYGVGIFKARIGCKFPVSESPFFEVAWQEIV